MGTPDDLQGLIARLATENPRWGAVRIQRKLLALGYEVSAETVRCYRRRALRPPPSQSWRTFLAQPLKRGILDNGLFPESYP